MMMIQSSFTFLFSLLFFLSYICKIHVAFLNSPIRINRARRKDHSILFFQLTSSKQTIPSSNNNENNINDQDTAQFPSDHSTLSQNNKFYKIIEAKRSDLPAIVQLRTEVFHPQNIGDAGYFSSLLSKISSRYNLGSIFLIATSLPTANSTIEPTADHQTLSSSGTEGRGIIAHPSPIFIPSLSRVIGTLEINAFDFYRNISSSLSAHLRFFGAKKKLYLGDLAVKAIMRRKGIASSLLKAVDEIARRDQYEEIYLHIEKAHPEIIPFYTQNGYHIEPYTAASIFFTEQHLQSPAENYLLLCKRLTI